MSMPVSIPRSIPRSIPTLTTLDTRLARLARDNAAAALRAEADRRLAWRHEESEWLLLADPVEDSVAR